MTLVLNDEQRMLRESAVQLLDDLSGVDVRRALRDSDADVCRCQVGLDLEKRGLKVIM